jgi:hypothetical protein
MAGNNGKMTTLDRLREVLGMVSCSCKREHDPNCLWLAAKRHVEAEDRAAAIRELNEEYTVTRKANQ